MNTVGDLEKLVRMHKEGALTDAEFAQAKAQLLKQIQPEKAAEGEESRTLGEAANRYVGLQKIKTVIGLSVAVLILVIMFFQFYLFNSRFQSPRFQPSDFHINNSK